MSALERKATEFNDRQEAQARAGVAEEVDRDEMQKRAVAAPMVIAQLLRKRARLLEYRRDAAVALAQAFHDYAAPCRAVVKVNVDFDECERYRAVETRARLVAEELGDSITKTRTEADEYQAKTPQADNETEPQEPALQRPAPLEFDRTLEPDQVRHLLGPDELEAQIQAELAPSLYPGFKDQDTVEHHLIEVGPSSLRFVDMRHSIVSGKEKREFVAARRYRLFSIDGVTRLLLPSSEAEKFDPDLVKLLGLGESAKECLVDDSFYRRCPIDGPNPDAVQAVVIETTSVPPKGRWTNIRPRVVVYGGYDPTIKGILGVGLAAQSGLQLYGASRSTGSFSRWRLVTMLGVQGDLLINLDDRDNAEDRLELAISPQVILQLSRDKMLHVEPGKSYDTMKGPVLDLTAALTYDTLERAGISLATTVRPNNGWGLYARWNHYGDGDAVVGGIEMGDRLALLPAAGVVTAALAFAMGYAGYRLLEALDDDDPTR